MVNDTSTTLPAAANPVAAAIRAHQAANATYLAAFERSWNLIEAVDPDLDFDDLDDVRAKVTAHYVDTAPAELEKLLQAREASRTAGEAEDAAWERFAAVLLTSAADGAAYLAYVKAHAATQDGAEVVLLRRAMDRVAELLSERLVA